MSSSAVVVRGATGSDLERLAELRLAMLAENREIDVDSFDPDFPKRTLESLVRSVQGQGLVSWLALREGAAIGAVSLLVFEVGPLPEDTRPYVGLLKDLYVVPQGRSRGVGTLLLSSAVAYAEQQNLRRIDLTSTPMARRLYEALGFSKTDDHLEMPVARV